MEALREDQAAAAAAKGLADWTDKIRRKIRGNIVLPPGVVGNPEAIFDVSVLPDGVTAQRETSTIVGELGPGFGHRTRDKKIGPAAEAGNRHARTRVESDSSGRWKTELAGGRRE